MNSLLCVILLAASSHLVSAANLDTVYEWKYIDYLWPSESEKQEAIQNGTYDPSLVLPMDVDKYIEDGRVFITLLHMDGVPATLATVSDQQGPSGPLLKPYPDWSWFKKGDCDSIISIYRIAIDECSRLWVLDNGNLGDDGGKCPPQLLSFDLKTNRMINRIKIPKDYSGNKKGESLLSAPIVLTEGSNCESTTVFMSDVLGEGLVVLKDSHFYRLENEVFRHQEDAKTITVGNYSFDYPAGINGMALSPKIRPGESRSLYFRPLSSFDIYSVEIQAIKAAVKGGDLQYNGAKNVLSSQAVGQAFSSQGILFLGMSREMTITCWNRYTELTKENIVTVAESDKLDYLKSLKVIPASDNVKEELWVLSDDLTYLKQGKLDENVVNFRVLKAPVHRLVDGTKCNAPRKDQKIFRNNSRKTRHLQ